MHLCSTSIKTKNNATRNRTKWTYFISLLPFEGIQDWVKSVWLLEFKKSWFSQIDEKLSFNFKSLLTVLRLWAKTLLCELKALFRNKKYNFLLFFFCLREETAHSSSSSSSWIDLNTGDGRAWELFDLQRKTIDKMREKKENASNLMA